MDVKRLREAVCLAIDSYECTVTEDFSGLCELLKHGGIVTELFTARYGMGNTLLEFGVRNWALSVLEDGEERVHKLKHGFRDYFGSDTMDSRGEKSGEGHGMDEGSERDRGGGRDSEDSREGVCGRMRGCGRRRKNGRIRRCGRRRRSKRRRGQGGDGGKGGKKIAQTEQPTTELSVPDHRQNGVLQYVNRPEYALHQGRTEATFAAMRAPDSCPNSVIFFHGTPDIEMTQSFLEKGVRAARAPSYYSVHLAAYWTMSAAFAVWWIAGKIVERAAVIAGLYKRLTRIDYHKHLRVSITELQFVKCLLVASRWTKDDLYDDKITSWYALDVDEKVKHYDLIAPLGAPAFVAASTATGIKLMNDRVVCIFACNLSDENKAAIQTRRGASYRGRRGSQGSRGVGGGRGRSRGTRGRGGRA
ncbi:hypothetical protein K440DRAFT_642195 [Wilcoxina mikolae CBS 423.85]|nr:hypothetical protein K440DRAFT_642195 [Wilcoxina mikolae CBS 423.85]